jgi:predicted transcriptional regulator of viral defense system
LGGQPPSNRLIRDKDFQSLLYTVCDGGSAQVMLDADPFCYLSHASALAVHRLAPEPSELQVSTPERGLWSAQARVEMTAALGFELEDADEDDLPFPLTRPQPHAWIRDVTVHRHETRTPLPRDQLGPNPIRVTPIGMSFRDTLAAPAWCGGMPTIVALWRINAAGHRDAIIEAISASDEKIVRVRAGYLLEEMLGIEDPRIEAWVADAQRGSSRKLDPSAPYAPRFSARWMLSINVDDATLPATTLG